MNNLQLLQDLEQQHLAWQPVISRRYKRLTGQTPLFFVNPNEVLADDLKNFHVNLCQKLVTALSSMVAVKGISGTVSGRDVSPDIQKLWDSSNLGDMLTSLVNSTLGLGTSWLSVWVDSQGKASVAVEPTTEMSMILDPVSHKPVAAAKLWISLNPDGSQDKRHAMLYTPKGIFRYEAQTYNDWHLKDQINNPLGVVPVVKLTNILLPEDKHTAGHSVLDAAGSLVDAITRLSADLLTTSASNATPKRWVAGLTLEDNTDTDEFSVDDDPLEGLVLDDTVKNPLDADTWVLESENAKVGQLSGAALDNWSNGLEAMVALLSAVSSLPLFSLGVTSSIPSSAEALRAARADMEAVVMAFLHGITTDLEDAVKYMAAISLGADVSEVEVNIRWSAVGQREISKTADAILKLVDAGVLSTEEAKELIENV